MATSPDVTDCAMGDLLQDFCPVMSMKCWRNPLVLSHSKKRNTDGWLFMSW